MLSTSWLLLLLICCVELSHIIKLLLCRECLESIVGLLLPHHSWLIRHEGIRLLALHGSEGILTAHILLLLHHHVSVELLLHICCHHLHHLILLGHVHLRLFLLVAHGVRDEGRLVVLILLLLRLLLWHLIHHAEWICSRLRLVSVHASGSRVSLVLLWSRIEIE